MLKVRVFFFAIFCHLGQKKEACSTICEFEKMCNEEMQVRGELLFVAVERREKDKYTPSEELRFVSVALTPSEPEI